MNGIMGMSLGRWLRLAVGSVLVLAAAVLAVFWFVLRVYVPHDRCLVLERKTGAALPEGQILAEPGQKGIQKQALAAGRYFFNPFVYSTQLVPLTVIPAGDPKSWEWVHSAYRVAGRTQAGGYRFGGDFPKAGVLTRLSGSPAPDGAQVVDIDSPHKGVIRQVLTPGTYRINPYEYKVEIVDAVYIPAGFVGVVTSQFGDPPPRKQVIDVEATALAREGVPPGTPEDQRPIVHKWVNDLGVEGQSGVMRDVLQPGIYYMNPYVYRVQTVEVGFNSLSQVQDAGSANERISFPSSTGFVVELGVTVIWGIDPQHAPDIINEFGNVEAVQEKVIKPQLRSICRNRGSQYAARDFIQGERREEFQRVLTEELHDICAKKNIALLLALIREIEVHPPEGAGAVAKGSEAEDLKRQIQESNIAIERELTNQKLQVAATTEALLEEARKKVDIAREQISGDTRVKVAGIMAEGEKQAATITAQTELEVAAVEQEIAVLNGKKREILGRAEAEVQRLAKQADADGRKMLVDALGSARAYNLYTFARNFSPQQIRLFFAGEGTFWTDLNRLEDAAAARILSGTEQGPASERPQAGRSP